MSERFFLMREKSRFFCLLKEHVSSFSNKEKVFSQRKEQNSSYSRKGKENILVKDFKLKGDGGDFFLLPKKGKLQFPFMKREGCTSSLPWEEEHLPN